MYVYVYVHVHVHAFVIHVVTCSDICTLLIVIIYKKYKLHASVTNACTYRSIYMGFIVDVDTCIDSCTLLGYINCPVCLQQLVH